MRYTTILPALFALFLSGIAQAAIVEQVIDVPVTVTNLYGRSFDHTIKVTVFHDDARPRAPYLVLNHGRPASAADFARMGRVRYSENARYFVGLGFAVLVPTRVGYGVSGGVDAEYSGNCAGRDYAPAYAAAADQTEAVLREAARLPFVDLSRGLVVGQSFGGMTALTLSTRALPGLVAAVNFASGGGGNPSERPEQPCSPERLQRLFASYGAAAKVPTLWFYSENDRFWGPKLPRQWLEAFVAAGGRAQFVALPAHKDDGHGIFTGNPESWRASFEAFVRSLGL